MAMEWRWMTGWWWAGLVIVTLLLARSLHRVISKICRPRDELRSGTLQDLTPTLQDAKFEIIAVPGLGAHPYHTWEARKIKGSNEAEYQIVQPARVHLLNDLLADEFPDARILNFAHDSNWLIDAPVKTTEEIGKCLLKEIKANRSSPHLPIIFIGHSLGGIIVKQALCGSDSRDIVDATAGIIFLGAPHQGSSVSVAGAVLASVTGILGSDTTLLLSLQNHDAQLSNLADAFGSRIAPNERRPQKVPIISFYETKKTYLLGLSLGVVVSRDSATVHADADKRHSIETDHSGLNKCGGPSDTLFTELAAAIRRLKTPSLLEQADTLIRDKRYTADKLKIERLSGELLPMEQCYINLAIVEQSGPDAGHSTKKEDTTPSPFSIFIRQKVETPDKTMQVELATIFNERKGSDGQPMHPRRILIRGRAGVGKTTLCKKIVHEFTKVTWVKWNELFDRVLWVPLRNLKLPERRKKAQYTLEHLFSHEFLLPTDGPNLARALSCALETKSSKTLFLLDGLDEVSQDLTGNSSMACFLAELLNQPNVVITSRPSAKPPPNLDLELETIGFGPDQLNEYIEKSFTNPKTSVIDRTKVDKVQSFLEERWLIQGLVRIPIQLDALCYTWDDLKPDAMLNTMTAMYKEIELKLWKKDVLRLKKTHEDKELTEENIATAGRRKIEGFVRDEMVFIESLAFTGLYNDVIDFTSEHLDSISDRFTPNLLPDKTLPSLSFLRTSDLSSDYRNQNYHFIHLTFQEYFAARYFVRQWKDSKGQLWFFTLSSMNTGTKASPPAEFLRKHKYTARYDIFWRFVSGLLDGSDQPPDFKPPDFITTIEEEPLDLLGPTHQRLVMHCLSEISSDLPTRKALEERLAQWLLFQCKYNKSASLASEVEFPEVALKTALLDESSDVQESRDVQKTILQSLASRASMPQSIAEVVAARLDDEAWSVRSAAVMALGGRAALPSEVLTAVAARLGDEDWVVREAAVDALGGRSALPDEVLTAVAARLDDEVKYVRGAAVEALGGRAALPGEVLTAVAARLGDEDWVVRRAAVEALRGRAALPGEVLTAVAARLGDEDWVVRSAAVEALGGWVTLPGEVLTALVARLGDEDWIVRSATVEALGGWVTLPGEVLTAVAARLGDEDADVRRAAVRALGGRAALPDEVLTAVAARLDDEDADVRRAAVWALGGRAALPDEVLTAVAARLSDEDGLVRKAAVWALGGRAALPGDILTAVAARLGDEDGLVRRAAVEALGGRAALPNETLTAVAARLDDEDGDVRRSAVDILLQRHKQFCCTLLKGPLVSFLYKALLERSFKEQLSWYIAKDNSYINMPDGIIELSVDIEQNEFWKWINGARPVDCPSTSGGESLSHN